MREDGELLEMTPDALRKVVQSDSELSEILLRAFILRRVALIADHRGDAVLIGSSHSAATLRIREFLTRNGQPHTYLDVEEDPGVQALLDRFQLRLEGVPVVICRYDRVLKNPTNEEIADSLGLNVAIEPDRVRDVAAEAPSVLAGDEPRRRLCGRRRPIEQRQARRVGRRRGVDLRPVHPSDTGRMRQMLLPDRTGLAPADQAISILGS